MQEIAYEYCKDRSQDEIWDFIDPQRRIRNPSPDTLLTFVGKFSNAWKTDLETNYIQMS